MDGFSIAPDDTMVVRTDTYGAYLWDGAQWDQLVNSSSMPTAFVQNGQLYNNGVFEIQIAPSNSNDMYMVYPVYPPGVYPPLSGVYKTTNKGVTWTETSFTPVDNQTSLAANGPYRMWGQKMAVNPTNPNNVYFGTGAEGLFVTSDGGNTWSSVSGVPQPYADSGMNLSGVAYSLTGSSAGNYSLTGGGTGTYVAGAINFFKNPSANSSINVNGTTVTFVTGTPGSNQVQIQSSLSATLASTTAFLNGSVDLHINQATYSATATTITATASSTGAGGDFFYLNISGNYPGISGVLFNPSNANTIFAASYGNGIYELTNGGTSWSNIASSSGPTTDVRAAISSNGTYFAVDSGGNLWVYATSSTWTEAIAGLVNGVAVDPFNAAHVVATQYGGQLDESFNSGATWSGWSDNSGASKQADLRSERHSVAGHVWNGREQPFLRSIDAGQIVCSRR